MEKEIDKKDYQRIDQSEDDSVKINAYQRKLTLRCSSLFRNIKQFYHCSSVLS